MENRRHILICGEVGVGKSTLLRRLLENSRRPLLGFATKRIPTLGEDGLFPVYIHPAAQRVEERAHGPENLVGKCDRVRCFRYPETFDVLGVTLLQSPPDGLILMDELGFMERDARTFCGGVLRALDGDIPVLAAVKSRDTDFLRVVKTHPNAALYSITEENRDALYPLLLPRILEWNREIDGRGVGSCPDCPAPE